MQTEEMGGKNIASMSKVELAMRSDDPSMLNAWQRRKGKGVIGKVSTSVNPDPTLQYIDTVINGDIRYVTFDPNMYLFSFRNFDSN